MNLTRRLTNKVEYYRVLDEIGDHSSIHTDGENPVIPGMAYFYLATRPEKGEEQSFNEKISGAEIKFPGMGIYPLEFQVDFSHHDGFTEYQVYQVLNKRSNEKNILAEFKILYGQSIGNDSEKITRIYRTGERLIKRLEYKHPKEDEILEDIRNKTVLPVYKTQVFSFNGTPITERDIPYFSFELDEKGKNLTISESMKDEESKVTSESKAEIMLLPPKMIEFAKKQKIKKLQEEGLI